MQQFTGCFPNHDGFVALGHLLYIGDDAKKVAEGDKTNHGWKILYKLLHVCL